jgi:hypothetical protein
MQRDYSYTKELEKINFNDFTSLDNIKSDDFLKSLLINGGFITNK